MEAFPKPNRQTTLEQPAAPAGWSYEDEQSADRLATFVICFICFMLGVGFGILTLLLWSK